MVVSYIRLSRITSAVKYNLLLAPNDGEIYGVSYSTQKKNGKE